MIKILIQIFLETLKIKGSKTMSPTRIEINEANNDKPNIKKEMTKKAVANATPTA